MKKNLFASIAIFTTVFFVSCQKEADTPSSTSDITGTWTFISMEAATSAVVEASQGSETDKTVTTSNYTTQNNTGTIVIDASTMKMNDVAYSVNTTAKAYIYQNNELTDSLEMPLNFTAPASSGSMSYRYITGDSIYFDQGTLLMNGATQNTVPGGARIKLEGDILYLTESVHDVSEQQAAGVTIKKDESGTVVIKMKRQ